MNTRTKTKEYPTHDLGLSAALITRGHGLRSLNRSDLRKVQFIFSKSPSLDQDANLYWSGGLSIEARAFFNNIKMLKNRIYSE